MDFFFRDSDVGYCRRESGALFIDERRVLLHNAGASELDIGTYLNRRGQ